MLDVRTMVGRRRLPGVELLGGGDGDGELILALGGPPARWVFTGGPPGPAYWLRVWPLRVWPLRGLLWAWEEAALTSVQGALTDEAWRVREMALKVVARHRLEDALAAVVDLRRTRLPESVRLPRVP